MVPFIPEVGSLTFIPIVGLREELELGVRYPTAKEASRWALSFTRLSQDEALRLKRIETSGPVPDGYETPEHTEGVYQWASEILERSIACIRSIGEPSPVLDPSKAQEARTRALEIVGRLTIGEQVMQAIQILREVGHLPESFRPPPKSGGDTETV